ncbi:hypothetical protein DYB36_007469 [Aphanomyces astaci]|uniref:Uncharacterized protein n=1 Tax=Aphanomyces astaci TaxID=112090 RepID=A0A396ZV69_APHAT|nr:hypothetical protein DYB36_007469 [Aphanomyces astaci]
MGGLGLGLGMGGSINNYGAPVAPPSIPSMYVNQPQQQQQQQVPPPIMYDSIKNLLQKKPDIVVGASGNGEDPFSCFTNKPSSRTNSGNLNLDTKPPPSNGSYDPFSGGATPASTPTSFGSQSNATPTANLSIFGDVAPSTGHISSSSTTPKNSALADRLRGGKRQTQESQRASLAINSTAVSTSGGTSVSIKKQLGGNTAPPATSSSLAAVPTTSPDNLLGF